MKLTVLAVGGLMLLPAHAATVEVSVRERQGGLLAGQRVTVQATPGPGEIPGWNWNSRRMEGVTGPSGKATFDKVPVGRYTVSVGAVGAGYIDPSANPAAPPLQITIAAEADKVAVEIELWRGSLLSGEIIVDRANIPRGARVKVRSLDEKRDGELALDARGHVEQILPPGRYELELVAPPGYLLVDVVWNGESVPGHVVRFDVREDRRKQSVSWYLSATCLITGKVADEAGECPARVVATLVQPGAWIQAVTERGGSTFQVVPHQEWIENTKCSYRLWLPDGQWTVEAQGSSVLSSDPGKVDVAISPWETRTLDFRLTTKDGDDERGQPLIVGVRTPKGRGVVGATVEVWPLPAEGATAPLQTARTEGYGGTVTFRGLAAGSYLVVAGHEAFLEGTTEVEGYDPKADEPRRAVVTLSMGAKLHGHAVDENGRPVQGVELSYTRLDKLPKTALADEGVLGAKRSGSALTDVTGHAEVGSLYSGTYRVGARLTGEKGATRFVVFRQRGARSIDVGLTEGQRTDLELLVYPAASLAGGLVCSDRGTMPPQVSFRIFAAEARVEGLWRDDALASGAALSSDDDVLRGPGADRFHLGPLSAGAYRLAARPAGQRYWSWASNELMPDHAAVFPIDEAQAVDTGTVEIECGPVLAVLPAIKSNEPVPDLRLGVVRASLRPAGEGRVTPGRDPDVDLHADRAFVRRLREGKFKTTLTVGHPYFVPPSMTVPEQVLDLVRGNVVSIPVSFERLGGMVEVRGEGRASRLTPAEGDPVLRPLVEGRADFPGTIPGTYRVELCADPDCSTVTATWSVAVSAGKTTFLP
ncbi:MAG TPA: carboxypeptidase-like regulatory domain-containing protein [Candidatus Bathyarchaeia archaeon]|nr:carboxypeptidase-like regulatory domain-containing protein [Candidatus Bathyarchaeia archaeon]